MLRTMMPTRKYSLLVLAGALILTGPALRADDTEDYIKEGLKAYKDGNYTEATKSLNYALGLINEKKADFALEALPKTIAGWEGDKGETQSLGALGGGNVVSRNYRKEEKRAQISISMDSPLVQQMMGLLTNPIFAGQAGRPRKVNGHDAIYNKENGELTMVVDNRILIKIEASDSSEEEILSLAKAINLDALRGKK